MTKQNFCFVILAACKGRICLNLIDVYDPRDGKLHAVLVVIPVVLYIVAIMTKQNFCFVILAACKGKKCLDLIDEYDPRAI